MKKNKNRFKKNLIIILLTCLIFSSGTLFYLIKNDTTDSNNERIDNIIYKIVNFYNSIDVGVKKDPYRNYDDPGEKDDYVFSGIKQCAWRGVTYSINPEKGYKDRYAPENSFPAYRRAIEEGFDYLWLASVRFSTNEEFYIIHDADTERVIGEKNVVAECSSEQINSLRLLQKGWNSWGDEDLKIPTLEEALQFAQEHNQPLGIRLGALPPDRNTENNRRIWIKFVEICRKYEICKESIFSGSLAQISVLNYYEPGWHVQATCSSNFTKEENDDLINKIVKKSFYKSSVIVYKTNLDQSTVDLAHKNGVFVFGVSDEPIIKEDTLDLYKKLKIDAIITHCRIPLDSE